MDDLAEWVSVARELAVELRKVPDTTRIAGLANELSLAIERAWPQKKPLREFSFSNGTRIEVMRKDGRDPTIQWKIGRVNDKERLAHGRGHGVLLSGGTGFATKAQLICDKYEIDPPLLSDLHCLQRIALTISDKPPFGDPAEARELAERIERLLPSSRGAAVEPVTARPEPADTVGPTIIIDETDSKILDVLADKAPCGLTCTELAKFVRLDRSNVLKRLKRMAGDGFAVVERKLWTITDKGREAIALD